VDRSHFSDLSHIHFPSETDQSKRTDVQKTKVQVIRVIFARGYRKWQFAWNGVKISAPILDDNFLDRLQRHETEIGWGDVLDVVLRINQARDPENGVWLNESYEILEVRGREAAPRQAWLEPR
jgi:hypothetical protein